jgi:hypothetical protein
MSKYLTFPDMVLKDRRLLLAALAELGYTEIEEGKRFLSTGITATVERRRPRL